MVPGDLVVSSEHSFLDQHPDYLLGCWYAPAGRVVPGEVCTVLQVMVIHEAQPSVIRRYLIWSMRSGRVGWILERWIQPYVSLPT
jgi:hypothetical protein